MFKKKYTKLEQIGLVVMIGVIGMFFYLKLVYDPAIVKYNAYREKIVKLAKTVEELKAGELTARGKEGLEKRLRASEKDLSSFEKVLAQSEQESQEVIIQLLELMEGNRLSIVEYGAPGMEAVKETVNSMLYQRQYLFLRLNGSYDDFLTTLSKIADLPWLVTVETVNIAIPKGGRSSALDFSLIVSI